MVSKKLKEQFQQKPFNDNIEQKNKLSQLIATRKNREEKRIKSISEEKRREQTIKWTSFYRRNWNLYAAHRLKIHLHPFQHIMIYFIGVSQVWWGIASRGISKTFVSALAAMIYALLYPNAEIHITSSTINQAKKMVQEKMDRELCEKLSPILKYMKEQGMIKFHYGKDEITVNFFNGSKIWVDPADEQSRGNRSCFNIYEEARIVPKNVVDSIFEPMLRPRQSMFRNNPKYADDPRWLEEARTVYITSAHLKSDWIWTSFKKAVQECFNNKTIPYNFYASDIYLAIYFNIKTKSDYFKLKKQSDEMNFQMETLNLMLGMAENAFFDRDDFKRNQVIQNAFIPPTVYQILDGTDKTLNRQKQDNEYRILFVDYAFANTTSKEKNDNTIIGCMYGIYNDGEMKRGVDYITRHSASDSIGTEHLIRTLFQQYHADYLIQDNRNGGENFFNNLTAEWVNPEYPKELWNSHGLTVCADEDLNVVPKNKIDDLMNRTIDKQSIPCIIPFIGTAELNSNMWIQLRRDLQMGKISFLIDDLEFETRFEDTEDYYTKSVEERTEIRLPYTQTMLLINEAVNLTQEWRDGKVKCTEPRTGTKDAIVACAYGNYFFSKLENKLSISEMNGDNVNLDDWKFLAGF